MNYLLDTHTFIWSFVNDEMIPKKTKDIISDTKNDIYVSVVSFWEFSIKQSVGKLEAKGVEAEDLLTIATKSQFLILPLRPEEALSSGKLPWMDNHKDPFDRMLIWQALKSNMAIISKDADFSKYLSLGLKLIW